MARRPRGRCTRQLRCCAGAVVAGTSEHGERERRWRAQCGRHEGEQRSEQGWAQGQRAWRRRPEGAAAAAQHKCCTAPAPSWAARVSAAGGSGSDGRFTSTGRVRVSSRVSRAGHGGSTPGGDGPRKQQRQHSTLQRRTCAVAGGAREHGGGERQRREVREHEKGEGEQQGEQGWAQGQRAWRRWPGQPQQQHSTLQHRTCAVADGTSELDGREQRRQVRGHGRSEGKQQHEQN